MNTIDLIKKNGIRIEMPNAILSQANDKYIERHILEYEDLYYVVYDILDCYLDCLHYWDYECCNSLAEAVKFYYSIG